MFSELYKAIGFINEWKMLRDLLHDTWPTFK